jgi:lysophospholipase L1-like esterase
MSKTKQSIVRMMSALNIDEKICNLSRPFLSRTLEDQSAQQPQKQQRDRARFFYQLRQKRKQRRLQQGPLPVERHQQHDVMTVPLEMNKEKKLIVGIVGSSIARGISIRNIESTHHEVKLRYKSGSDCAEALSWLRSDEGRMFMNNVDQLIFILGTNDLHRTDAMQTVQRIARTVESVRYFYRGVKIVWQLLQSRTRKTWFLPEGQLVMREIERCNVFLLELAAAKCFDTIQPGIPISYMYDGLHPSNYGVHLMETTIRNYLQREHIEDSLSSSNIPPLMSIRL